MAAVAGGFPELLARGRRGLGTLAARNARIASSAPLSAAVTGVRSAFSSTVSADSYSGMMTSRATSAARRAMASNSPEFAHRLAAPRRRAGMAR